MSCPKHLSDPDRAASARPQSVNPADDQEGAPPRALRTARIPWSQTREAVPLPPQRRTNRFPRPWTRHASPAPRLRARGRAPKPLRAARDSGTAGGGLAQSSCCRW